MAPATSLLFSDENVFTYVLAAVDLELAKRQIMHAVGAGQPVIFIDQPLPSEQVQLTVIATHLTQGQSAALFELQQEGLPQRHPPLLH
ncbi:MAG: hypothetical protein ACO1RX_02190 [Candidatus Sericytochromatia bacterium]